VARPSWIVDCAGIIAS